MVQSNRKNTIEAFDLKPGKKITSKYTVVSKLGEGWEGEVYMVREQRTGIERAAKIFFPQRNLRQKTSTIYAQRLHKLREVPIIIPYHVQDEMKFSGQSVVVLISDYVEGEILSDFIARQPGKRLSVFQAIHLLHALVVGLEQVHAYKDYHGDLHSGNVIIRRFGLGFDLKVLDLFHWGSANALNRLDDLIDVIKLFHEAVGGSKHYQKLPREAKFICCGLKRTLIKKRFRTISGLRTHLETMRWT